MRASRNGLLLLLLLIAGIQSAFAERTTTFFHTDGLGSVVAASNEQGALLWRKDYAPYGEQIDATPDDEALSYTGKQHDEVTGLTYFGARYYDAEIGRFLSIDPAGVDPANPFSFNRYAYANNNPYRYVDPDGRDPEQIFGIVMGIVHTKEDALRIQQAEFAANNFAAAGGIDTGIALSEAKQAFDEGESIKGGLAATTAAMIILVAKKRGAARALWKITKEGTAATMRHRSFGTFHKSKSDGLWWSKDRAGHGGSVWKVFEETADGLKWRADADKFGDFISGKHKSEVGALIPWSELAGVG